MCLMLVGAGYGPAARYWPACADCQMGPLVAVERPNHRDPQSAILMVWLLGIRKHMLQVLRQLAMFRQMFRPLP